MSNRIAVFDDGIVQQLASPSMLYEKPDNAFVAQFIGENNVLRGKVTSVDGDSCHVDVGNNQSVHALKVNVDKVGENSTLSIRPERVMLDPGPEYNNVFEGKVEELIYLGDHIRTRMVVCGDNEFIVKIPNSGEIGQLREGDTAKVGWKMEDCRALDGVS